MASVQAGVTGMAEVSRNPTQTGAGGGRYSLSSPATWSYIWVGLSVGYLVSLYALAGGFRGSVGS